MLLVYGPVLLIALIPIILIETPLIDRRVRLGFRPMLKRVAAANAVSTLVGIPLTWIGLVLVEFVLHESPLGDVASLRFVVQAPWLFPHEADLAWLIPSAGVVLTVPFWIVSVFVESAVLNRMLPKDAEGVCRSGACARLRMR